MAISVEISSDIRAFEPKVISIFTMRQLACVGIGIAYAVPIALLIPGLDLLYKLAVAGALAAPAILCGWIKPYGIPLEKFVLSTVIPMLTAPPKRLYETELQFQKDLAQFETKSEGVEGQKKRINYSSKNPPRK